MYKICNNVNKIMVMYNIMIETLVILMIVIIIIIIIIRNTNFLNVAMNFFKEKKYKLCELGCGLVL